MNINSHKIALKKRSTIDKFINIVLNYCLTNHILTKPILFCRIDLSGLHDKSRNCQDSGCDNSVENPLT